MKTLFAIIVLFALVSCSKDDKRMKKKASIEAESSSQSQVRVENANQSAKADQMEKDLKKRHRFYQAVKGIYEGTISTNFGTFNIRLTLTPSLAPMNHNRVRQLEEIAADLNNLSINAQVLQWDPRNDATAIGCRLSGIRPDIEKGTLALSTESCPNLYQISITEQSFRGSNSENASVARRVAEQVLEGDLRDIDSINGTVQPSTNATIFKFVAQKVEE
jgi:hypothetical protein